MKWNSGNIAEAVRLSKQQGAVFFVAIFGEDEASRKLEDSLMDPDVTTELSSNRYVCIRLTGNSQEHLQFKQIYSNAEAPCLYFISLMGAAVEVVQGEISSSDLKKMCDSAWDKHSKVLQTPRPQQEATQVPPEISAPSSSTAPAANRSRENTPKPEESASGTVGDEESANANLSLEEKIERARQLAAARLKLKMEEEAEEERQREKERREAGKGMAELKRWQDEQEAKRLVEERKRDKQEEQLLRQRLREQIAQDRAERNKRTNASIVYDGAEPSSSSQASALPPKPGFTAPSSANYAGKARLQFRMPDGSSQSHTFEQDVTLGHVRTFLSSGGHVKFSNFSLCVAFPRREFTEPEYSQKLNELGLLPSAALLVLPAGGKVFGGPGGGGGGAGIWALFTTLLGYLIYPVTLLFGVLQRALPSSGTTTTGEQGTPDQPSGSRSSTTLGRGENRLGGSGLGASYKSQADTKNSPGTSSEDLRKRNTKSDRSSEGNIHRLRNQESDSDDELGTWNGNSTQQKPR